LRPTPPDDSAHFLWVIIMEIKTYSQAKADGDKFYFTGKKCPHGHLSPRYTSTGQCLDCVKAQTARQVKGGYFKEHYKNPEVKERKKANGKVYRERTRERQNEMSRLWVANNPEKARAVKQNYKAKRRKWEGAGISSKELGKWIKTQPKTCYWCGTCCKSEYHLDHYTPLSKGGAHTTDNMVIACPSCNLRKNNKDPYDWAQEVGRLF